MNVIYSKNIFKAIRKFTFFFRIKTRIHCIVFQSNVLFKKLDQKILELDAQ